MIYLDYNATTPLDPRVLEAILPFFRDCFGNAASRSHAYGWTAEEAVSQAREKIAALVGAQNPKEIVFTSGATESNNAALIGFAGSPWTVASYMLQNFTKVAGPASFGAHTPARFCSVGIDPTLPPQLPPENSILTSPSPYRSAVSNESAKRVLISFLMMRRLLPITQ